MAMKPLVHVSKRAIEALAYGGWEPPMGYSCRPGITACGAPTKKTITAREWCGTEHVRAMLHLQPYAKVRRTTIHGKRMAEEVVIRPTCPKCSVMLDEALSTAVATPHPDAFVYDPATHTPEKLVALGFVPMSNSALRAARIHGDPREALYNAARRAKHLYNLTAPVAASWHEELRRWVDRRPESARTTTCASTRGWW